MILAKDNNGNILYVDTKEDGSLPHSYTVLTQVESDSYNLSRKKLQLKSKINEYSETLMNDGFIVTLPDNTGTYTFKSDKDSQENIDGALTALSRGLTVSGKWITKDGQVLTGLTPNDFNTIGQGIVTHKENITFTAYAKIAIVDSLTEVEIDTALADIVTFWNLS